MPFSNKERAKEYRREYHQKNWAKLKVKHGEAKRKRRAQLIAWLKTFKSNLKCIKCSENHPDA